MRARTSAGLLTRLERLECRLAARDQPIKLRLGHLKRLPREYQGERHVIVARELPKQGSGRGHRDSPKDPGGPSAAGKVKSLMD
jgi:hypothetical protein